MLQQVSVQPYRTSLLQSTSLLIHRAGQSQLSCPIGCGKVLACFAALPRNLQGGCGHWHRTVSLPPCAELPQSNQPMCTITLALDGERGRGKEPPLHRNTKPNADVSMAFILPESNC